jgi:hypothetical protein
MGIRKSSKVESKGIEFNDYAQVERHDRAYSGPTLKEAGHSYRGDGCLCKQSLDP